MAATLVVGVTLATTQSTQSAFAYPQKKRGQDDSKNGNTVTIQACKQRESVSGFDNTAEQECENLICTHPGNNATCTEKGSTTASAKGAAKRTCEQCFKTFLTPDQITGLMGEHLKVHAQFLEVGSYYQRVNSEAPWVMQKLTQP